MRLRFSKLLIFFIRVCGSPEASNECGLFENCAKLVTRHRQFCKDVLLALNAFNQRAPRIV